MEPVIEDDGSGQPLLDEGEDVSRTSPIPKQTPFRMTTTAKYCLLFMFLLETFNIITMVPTLTLYERKACQAYYGIDFEYDEAACKIPEVQSEVARIRGWQGGFNTLAGKGMRSRPFKSTPTDL
jgi:hypothetical protein